MNEAIEETTMRALSAKENAEREREVRLSGVYDRMANLRDVVALARVATVAVAREGDKDAINGLAWAMHMAQVEADDALADLNAMIAVKA